MPLVQCYSTDGFVRQCQDVGNLECFVLFCNFLLNLRPDQLDGIEHAMVGRQANYNKALLQRHMIANVERHNSHLSETFSLSLV